MSTPPPLPVPEKSKSANKTLWIVLACIGGLLVLSVPITLAILIPTVGKVRETAQRTADQSWLRQITQASLLWASDHDGMLLPTHLTANGEPEGRNDATIHAVAAALARDGGLNEATGWFSAHDQGRPDSLGDPKKLTVVLDRSTDTLDPNFVRHSVLSWDYATGLSFTLPPTTPVAWTRGLQPDGTWDPATSVYAGDGGFIAFLGGNVMFFRDLKATPLIRPDGKRTSNVLETLPATARVVGSGPGTLHNARGLAGR